MSNIYKQAIENYIAIKDFNSQIHAVDLLFIQVDEDYYEFGDHNVLHCNVLTTEDMITYITKIMKALPEMKRWSDYVYDKVYFGDNDMEYAVCVYEGIVDLPIGETRVRIGISYDHKFYG